MDVFMCYKQKCKVVSLNLAHPVFSSLKLFDKTLLTLTMSDGFSFDWRLSEAGRNRNNAVAITSHPITIIIIIMLKPLPARSPFGPGTATTNH